MRHYLLWSILALLAVCFMLAGCEQARAPYGEPPLDKMKQQYGFEQIILREVVDENGCPNAGDHYQYGYRVGIRTKDSKVLSGVICHRQFDPHWNILIDGSSLFLNR